MEHAGPRHFVEQPAHAGQETEGQDDVTPDSEEESGRDNRHDSIQVLLHQEYFTPGPPASQTDKGRISGPKVALSLFGGKRPAAGEYSGGCAIGMTVSEAGR